MAFRHALRRVSLSESLDLTCNWSANSLTARDPARRHYRTRSRLVVRSYVKPPGRSASRANGEYLIPSIAFNWPISSLKQVLRKPIYPDLPTPNPQKRRPEPSVPSLVTEHPTPTDRLATQVRRCRIFVYDNVKTAEDGVNNLMSAFLAKEQSFTSTIASLAPSPQTGEQIMPGALYVLVASMAGSILSRNRNILLRAATPAAAGLGAAYVVLPYTMKNVGDLMWSFEEKSEFVAVNHLRIRGVLIEGWKQAKIWSEKTREWSEEVVKEGRETIERWVRKGQ